MFNLAKAVGALIHCAASPAESHRFMLDKVGACVRNGFNLLFSTNSHRATRVSWPVVADEPLVASKKFLPLGKEHAKLGVYRVNTDAVALMEHNATASLPEGAFPNDVAVYGNGDPSKMGNPIAAFSATEMLGIIKCHLEVAKNAGEKDSIIHLTFDDSVGNGMFRLMSQYDDAIKQETLLMAYRPEIDVPSTTFFAERTRLLSE